MATVQKPKSRSKSKQQEALQILDDLDSLPEAPLPAQPVKGGGKQSEETGDASEVLAFIDQITQKSSEPTRTTSAMLERPRSATPVRKPTERVKLGGSSTPTPGSISQIPSQTYTPPPHPVQQEEQPASGGGGWGLGGWSTSVWSSASAALQQARSVVDEQVKHLPNNDQAKKWREDILQYAKGADLEKITTLGQNLQRVGLSTLNEILNVVAPPISEHEVIQIWLSHDMQSYDGVESVVYKAFAKVMEQIEGGDLVVNRGNESKSQENESPDPKRDLNAVDDYETALKLSQANLEEIVKRNPQPPVADVSTTQNPTTYSYVYLRIQPFFSSYTPAEKSHQSLQFLLYLSDPSHQLLHSTVTQGIPGKWLDLWDTYPWVEDLTVEALRVGIEVLGQDYIGGRMGWTPSAEELPEGSGSEEGSSEEEE